MAKKQYAEYLRSIFVIVVSLLISCPYGFTQALSYHTSIYFFSDFQAPMQVEKFISKPYRNEEARDSIFADIIHQQPKNLFLLGDMTMKGSKHKAWATLDTFLISLKKTNTSVYAIPGNHEYIGKSAGMHRFKQRFPEEWLHGYCINIDSIAIVMLNSNFDKLTKNEISKQLGWYKAAVDSLDNDPRIKTIIVCTHHAPYSNSRIVGSSLPVQDLIVPVFEKSKKSKLFISGHSHNLEYFSGYNGKYFLVIGGGGGIAQPLIPMNKRIYEDLLLQDSKPLYFYLLIEKNGHELKLITKGFKKDFRFFESEIGFIPIN